MRQRFSGVRRPLKTSLDPKRIGMAAEGFGVGV
jgi:hypothetical protein